MCICALCSCGKYITQKGIASYYSDSFNGKKTANGEIFKNDKLTAAHQTLPFGTRVKVMNPQNGNSVKVRINDRGPFVKGRIIDLSKKAAEKLNMINDGILQVVLKYKSKKN
ncbi:MAG: septal ring lytic transglycosylase RlpA family protein [Bacteroidetes bacterium]|nr:septal ring lytic transglycosylase RlpA family protein [Bacteroidota bacterium]